MHPEPVEKTTPVHNPAVYILYDVNPSEGFNLRRDVYIRLAVFLRTLRRHEGYEKAKLVLPPWSNLYHWRTSAITQTGIPWSHFFDLDSMKTYADVLDGPEFHQQYREYSGAQESAVVKINEVYRLFHFEDMFENGVFIDKFEQVACRKVSTPNLGRGTTFLQFCNYSIIDITCVKFQGSASLLHSMFQKYKSTTIEKQRIIYIYSAEIVLHDFWGNIDYWEARRSMRFSRQLVQTADKFRLDYFNSTNESDRAQRPTKWMDEKPYRKARGGDYLCAHIRRADFLYGRERTTPSLHSAAAQIKRKLLELGLRKVFISSDCSGAEFHDLKDYLKRFKVVRFTPESDREINRLLDGGVAIIDQIICSHARYFIGTYESTFTYRIYEEREILGFPKDLTFNTFCKNEEATNCEKNSVWSIQYE